MKKIPWLSLMLLLAAYSTFSWYLYQSHQSELAWLSILFFALFQALVLTAFSRLIQSFLDSWLKSDLGYFSAIVLLSLFSLAALVWIHVFGRVMLLIAAAILARLDLQNRGFNQLQALLCLSIVSLLGLGVGWSAQYLR